jgi:hypothetical protein
MDIQQDVASRLSAASAEIFAHLDCTALPWESASLSHTPLTDAANEALFIAFSKSAEQVLGHFASRKSELTEYLAKALVKRDLHALNSVSARSWAIAYNAFLFFDLHITQRPERRFVLYPAYFAYYNISGQEIVGKAVELPQKIEHMTSLEMRDAKPFRIVPGDVAFFDGSKSAHWFEGNPIPALRMTTRRLGIYEAVLDVESGHRLTLSSADLAVGRVETLLRLFGAARDCSIMDVAAELTQHPVRELRWSALNYFHRVGSVRSRSYIEGMCTDSDATIRRLASKSLASLQPELGE